MVITPIVTPVVPVNELYCPRGAKFDPAIGFCTTTLPGVDVVAIGYFTLAMTDLGERSGGGAACHKAEPFTMADGWILFMQRWHFGFTAGLRGTGVCPLGASPSAANAGLCVESGREVDGRMVKHVYGPFPANVVEKCLANGGGSHCYSLRWSDDFHSSLIGR